MTGYYEGVVQVLVLKTAAVVAASGVAMGGGVTGAGLHPEDGTGASQGWHPVDEEWHAVSYDGLFLPAGTYCEGFDLRTTTEFQDVSAKVTTRWSDGAARTTSYRGPLISRATNESTGSSVELSLSGRARVLTRPDGSIAVYSSTGPIGMGWPQDGGGLERGFHVLRGKHVTTFSPDGTRELTVDRGPEVNVCELVD